MTRIQDWDERILFREITLKNPEGEINPKIHLYDVFELLQVIHDYSFDRYIIKFIVMHKTSNGLQAASYLLGKNFDTKEIEVHDHLDFAFKNIPITFVPCWMSMVEEKDIINLASSYKLEDFTTLISKAIRLK